MSTMFNFLERPYQVRIWLNYEASSVASVEGVQLFRREEAFGNREVGLPYLCELGGVKIRHLGRAFATEAPTAASRIHGSGRWRKHAPDGGSGSWLYGKVKKETDKRTRSVNTSFLWLSSGVFMFGMCFVAVPLYDMYCKSTGQGSTGGFATVGHKEYKPPPKEGEASKRIIKITFAGAVQSTLKWDFYPEQRSVYAVRMRGGGQLSRLLSPPLVQVTPGETALAFFRAKNRTNKPIIGMSTYHMLPLEAGLYFNKIQCFCFDEQLLGPHEEVDMPVFFFIDPDIMDDRRMDTVDEITLTYLFGPTQSEIPDEYEDLQQEIQTRKLGQPTTAMPAILPADRPDPNRAMASSSSSSTSALPDASVAGAVAGLDENASGAANSTDNNNDTALPAGEALKEILRTPSRPSPGGRRSSQRRHSHSGTPVEREERVRGSSVMDLVRNFESTIKKKARRPPLQPMLSERSKPISKGDDSDDTSAFLRQVKSAAAEGRSGIRVRSWKEAIVSAEIPEGGEEEAVAVTATEELVQVDAQVDSTEQGGSGGAAEREERTPERDVEVSCTSSHNQEWATPFGGPEDAEGGEQEQEGEVCTAAVAAFWPQGRLIGRVPSGRDAEGSVVPGPEEEEEKPVITEVPEEDRKEEAISRTPGEGKQTGSVERTPGSTRAAVPRQYTGKKSARRNSTPVASAAKTPGEVNSPAAAPTPAHPVAECCQDAAAEAGCAQTPIPPADAEEVTQKEGTPRSVRVPTPKPSAVMGDDPAITPPPSKQNSPVKSPSEEVQAAVPIGVATAGADAGPQAPPMPPPISTGGGIPPDVMAEAAAPADPDYSRMTLEERLKDKRWQVRLSAYTEIDRLFTDEGVEDKQKAAAAVELLVDRASVVTSETNPRSQEGACKAIAACTHGPNFSLGPFLPGLLEKYLAGNQKIHSCAVECLAKGIEGQEGLAKEAVVAVCEHTKGLLNPPKGKKMPSKGIINKQISGCLAALTSLLEAFGMTVVPPKEFLGLAVEACGSTDRGVREAGYALLVELYQWLPDVEACGNGLADNQMKEFKTRCERLGECQPKAATRFAYGATTVTGGAAGGANPAVAAQSTEDAAYDMLQPQDIFKMLPKDFVTSAAKWIDKRNAIAQLTALAKKHKKMVLGESAPSVVQCLMKVVKLDQNIPVATEACSALCAVANGLRGEMPHSRMLLLTMLTKVKEKNAGVLRQATGCIDALLKYQSLSLDSRLVEDLAGVINDKNPIGRREVLGICSRALPFVSADLLLPMAETVLLPCLDESDKVVREAACSLGDLILTRDDSLQGVILAKLHTMTAARRKAIEEKMKCLKVVSTPMSSAATTAAKPSVPTLRTGSTPASGQGSRVREISVDSTASRRVRGLPGSRAPGSTNRVNAKPGVARRTPLESPAAALPCGPTPAAVTPTAAAASGKGSGRGMMAPRPAIPRATSRPRGRPGAAGPATAGGSVQRPTGSLLRQATLTSSSSTLETGAALGVELVPAAGSRLRRQHNEKHSMWPVEDIPEALVSALHHQWNQNVNTQDACSALLLQKMFAPRGAFAEFVTAIDFWADYYRTVDDSEKPQLDEILDLLAKWCTWLLSTCKDNPQVWKSMLDLLDALLPTVARQVCPDSSLLERMGHKMAAFRGHIKNLVTTHLVNSEALVSAKAMVPMLINCIQTSKNKKSVADCLELLIGVLTQHQGTVTTGRAVKDVGRVLMSLYNDKDAAVREFAQTAIGHFVRSTGTEETIPRLREILMEPGFPLKQDHRNALNSKFDRWLLEKGGGGDCSINDDTNSSSLSRIQAPTGGRRMPAPTGIARVVAGHRRALTRVGAPMQSAAALPAPPPSSEAPARLVTSTAPVPAATTEGEQRESSPVKMSTCLSAESSTSGLPIEQYSVASSSMEACSMMDSSSLRVPGVSVEYPPTHQGRVSGGSDWSLPSATPAEELTSVCEALLRGGDAAAAAERTGSIAELSKKTKEQGESDPRQMLRHCDAFLTAAACAVELTLIARHGADVEDSERVLDLANFLATSATALDECASTSIKTFLRALLVSLSDREFRHKHYADWQRANMAVVTAMSNAETTIVYKALLELSREDERKEQLRVLITRCIDKLNRNLRNYLVPQHRKDCEVRTFRLLQVVQDHIHKLFVESRHTSRELSESGSMGDISPGGAVGPSSAAITSDDSIKRIVQTVCQIVGFAEVGRLERRRRAVRITVGEYMGVYVNDSDERQGWKNLMRDAEEQGRRNSDANASDRPVAG
ncbi:hypothetical protein FOL46_005691 [Perkinsus olseni]|uniref:TOG domain-containing protein n=1 Tax=Perkinsus olseni TaxID=32597 RepID=A0A7J6MRK7_PEROL|nr:hypothetical protein FOL46_005691 [Perkinsus olseni]